MEAYFNSFVKFLEIIPEESQQLYYESFLQKYGKLDWTSNNGK